ncbi:MAG: hypothetical protein CMP32_04415 [Rickettsiales bacterium]|nr:hypothetical protein [Rickettsiales bacterium]
METYLIFDLLILGLILLSAFFSFWRGFSLESLSLFTWVLSFFISYKFAGSLVNSINKFLENLLFSNIIAYTLTFLGVFFILSFITQRFSTSVKKSYVGIVDRTAGFFFGILRGYLIASLCLFAFHYFFKDEEVEWIDKSKFNFIILITNERILNFIDNENKFSKKFRKDIEEKSEKLFKKSVDSHLKLKKTIDESKKTYNEDDKKNLEYLIENLD